MGKYNAIRVSDEIERYYVDFSTLDSLKESTGFERLYTIHTASTQELSKTLGFHIAGFCDDHGEGGPDLASEIAGYDYLPSDLILCLMGDKYNFLPFDEGQLESLYLYLTTGEVKSSHAFKENDLGSFLSRNSIYPILPDFPMEPEVIFYKDQPNLALLKYDYSELSDKQIENFGSELFYYSDRLLEQYKEMPNGRLSPDERFYLHSQNDMTNEAFYILIEVLAVPGTESTIDIRDFLGLSSDEDNEEKYEVEDAAEEVMDQDYDDEDDYDYFLEFKVDGVWPESDDDYTLQVDRYALPYFIENENDEESGDTPPFSDFVRYKGLDRINDVLTVEVNQRHRRDTYDLKLDEPLVVPFDYISNQVHFL